jgi:hypothetical protein
VRRAVKVRLLKACYVVALLVVYCLAAILLVQAHETHNALCSLELSYRTRANDTERYVGMHPNLSAIEYEVLMRAVSTNRQTAITIDKKVDC